MTEHITPPTKIYLADSHIENAGRGVFAAANVAEGEVIETCPILEVPAGDYDHLKATHMRNYYFMWSQEDDTEKQAVICLGFGSLYNHSYEPNATYKKNFDEKTISFVALKAIQPDEEITVNYNYGNPDDKSKLWIEDVPEAEEPQPTTLKTRDGTLKITFVETQTVKEGVIADLYTFDDDGTRDLAIVHVAKGYKTPLQRILKGTKTIEGYMSGNGALTVTAKDGQRKTYTFTEGSDSKPDTEIEIHIGELMQWSAETDLTFYEICEPPYEDGRFENVE
jgi:hypothetical protein